LIHHLGNYAPDSIISEKNDVWIYKYRHQTQKDSVALFVYAPSRKGNKYPGYSLALNTKASQALEVSFIDQSKTGKTAIKPVSNGKVPIDIDEVPRLILFKEQ
ncbi:MAG: hypothetical protein WCF67_10735, partial [Chitinophagaceae bacterium]